MSGLSVANFNIENASGQAVRQDIEACFLALQGLNAESSDLGASQIVQGMWFLRSDTKELKIAKSTTGFTTVGNIDQANLGLLPRSGGSAAPMTGQFLADDSNSASTPSISFDANTGLGLFPKATNVMGFSSSGQEQMQFDANGITLHNANELRMHDGNSAGLAGSTYMALKPATDITTNFTLTFPANAGTNGQFLKTDGNGGLSWGDSGGGNPTFGNVTATNFVAQSAVIGPSGTNKPPYFANGALEFCGTLVKAHCKFSGTGTITIQTSSGVTSLTDFGVGDYQVNFNHQLKQSHTGNVTNDFSVSFAISGTVYNVPGQLAHTHAFIASQNSAHVRFTCAKTENSGQRADQPYAGVICCA